jgi:hypothetical protein
MRQPARLVGSDRDRLAALETRADAHDKVIAPMAEQVAKMSPQVDELYVLLDTARKINWFLVKAAAFAGGGLGLVAVVLTIAANGAKLFGH